MSARAVWSSILRTFRTFRTTFLVGLLVFITIMLAIGPFGFLVIPGLLGGVIAGLVMVRRHRFGSQPPTFVPPSEGIVSPTDVINAAHIRVAGVGGLGLVAMSAVIAIALPRVGTAVLLGLVGGAIAALLIVKYREKHGPMGSSDHGLPGARTVFVDSDPEPEGSRLHTDRPKSQSILTPAVVAKTA